MHTIGFVLNPMVWWRLTRALDMAMIQPQQPSSERVFVLLTGHPGVGKTTLCRQHPVLSRFIHFHCDVFHNRLAVEWPILFGEERWRRSVVFQRSILMTAGIVLACWQAAQRNQPMVCDFVNYNHWRRHIALTVMKFLGYRRVIIWAECNQEVRVKRLRSDPERQAPHLVAELPQLIDFAVAPGQGPAKAHEAETFIHYQSHLMRPEDLDLGLAPQPVSGRFQLEPSGQAFPT